MKLKILQVLDNYYPAIDGVLNVVENLAKHISEEHTCHVLAPQYPKAQIPEHNFDVTLIKSMNGGKYGLRLPLPMFDPKTRRLFKDNKFDIVHCHSPVTLGGYALKMAKKYKIPTVFTMHTKFHEEINNHVKSKFLQRFALNFLLKTIKKMDYVLAVSDGAAECLRNYGYVGEITILRNGTDFQYPDEKTGRLLLDSVNEKHNLMNTENVFLFVGRITSVKKVDFILRTLKILNERKVEFKMIIVGDGDQLEELKKQAKEFNISDKILFVGNVTDRSVLAGYFLRSDLFLFPSTFDSASLVILESAAMKLPAIVAEGSTCCELITDNQNGYTAGEDEQIWADKIQEVIADRNKLNQIKLNCYNTIFKSWKMVADDVVEIYKNCKQDYINKHNDSK